MKRYDDVQRLRAADLAPVDVLCGGFPCQDVSSAGKGAGLEGGRSGLWYEFRRIIEERPPPFVVVENVASGKARWLPTVRRGLCDLGYRTRAFALSAVEVGAPHLRRRVFVVAHRERDGLQRSEQAGTASRTALPDGDGDGVRVGSKRLSGRRSRAVRGEGSPQSVDDRANLAHGHGHGRERVAEARLHADGPLGDDAARRHRFPPGRGDPEGWAKYVAAGGPEPAIRGGAHGISAGVGDLAEPADDAAAAEQLTALGNAVVPQCAEVIGRIVMAIAKERGVQ